MPEHTSRLKGFYKLHLAERRKKLASWAALDEGESQALEGGISIADADTLVENVVGLYNLPFAIAPNFIINKQEMLVPLVIEEPSVVAAMSNAARLVRAGGGFQTSSTEPVMTGQIQLLDVPCLDAAVNRIKALKEELLAELGHLHPTIKRLGGGPLDLEVRKIEDTLAGPMLVVHLLMDTRDAMGANAINTVCEALSPELEAITEGRALLRILSNLSDHRRARAQCRIPFGVLSGDESEGADVAQGIFEANAFAVADPYRAATHNKGIFNGIDAVALATGQDWRAIEAGAHAYAARDGQYRSLTEWMVEGEELVGVLELPLAVGTVGGMTKHHPTARTALKILGNPNARTLSEIMTAAGLAQNLAALRALVSEGIQRGHMSLHQRRQQAGRDH
ncbi:MAG: hydroxymethylglutaryl-CoA reductase, degradative [Chloroflexi bacterium]|nr:hydroxymethylglutaryl-CoA reductase, degradative [Chloroflexota bacterium]